MFRPTVVGDNSDEGLVVITFNPKKIAETIDALFEDNAIKKLAKMAVRQLLNCITDQKALRKGYYSRLG